MAGHPTPYPEINAVLQYLLTRVQTLLGSDFVGLYRYGSLASGDFDPQRSDIDFLVATDGELPPEMLPAFASMHQRLAEMHPKWTRRLEGSYIPQQALRRYDPAQARHPSLMSLSLPSRASKHSPARQTLRRRKHARPEQRAQPPPMGLLQGRLGYRGHAAGPGAWLQMGRTGLETIEKVALGWRKWWESAQRVDPVCPWPEMDDHCPQSGPDGVRKEKERRASQKAGARLR